MNLSKRALRAMVSLTGAALLAASAHAQYQAGVRGTIQDKSGAAVAGAKVTLTNQGTGIQYEAVSPDPGVAVGMHRTTSLQLRGADSKVLKISRHLEDGKGSFNHHPLGGG